MASTALARITRYPVDPLDWAICPGLLFARENQWQGDRTGKTLPELLANLFSTSSPLTAKSNLDGQNPWFESEVVPDLKKGLKLFYSQ